MLQAEEETAAAFEAGSLPGWEDRGCGVQAIASSSSTTSGTIDLEAFDSVEELESLGGCGRRVEHPSNGTLMGL